MLTTPLKLDNTKDFSSEILNSKAEIAEFNVILSPSNPSACANFTAINLQKVISRVARFKILAHQDNLIFHNSDLLTYLHALREKFNGTEFEIIFDGDDYITSMYFEPILQMFERNRNLQRLTIVGLADEAINFNQLARLKAVLARTELRLQVLRIEHHEGYIYPFNQEIIQLIIRINEKEIESQANKLMDEVNDFQFNEDQQEQLSKYITTLQKLTLICHGNLESLIPIANFIFILYIEWLKEVLKKPKMHLGDRDFIFLEKRPGNIDVLNVSFYCDLMNEIVNVITPVLSAAQINLYQAQIKENRIKALAHCVNLTYLNFLEIYRDLDFLLLINYPGVDELVTTVLQAMSTFTFKYADLLIYCIKLVTTLKISENKRLTEDEKTRMLNEINICIASLLQKFSEIRLTPVQTVSLLNLIDHLAELYRDVDFDVFKKQFSGRLISQQNKFFSDFLQLYQRNINLCGKFNIDFYFSVARHVVNNSENPDREWIKIYFCFQLEKEKSKFTFVFKDSKNEIVRKLQDKIFYESFIENIFLSIHKFIERNKDNYIETDIGTSAYQLYLSANELAKKLHIKFDDMCFPRQQIKSQMYRSRRRYNDSEVDDIELDVLPTVKT